MRRLKQAIRSLQRWISACEFRLEPGPKPARFDLKTEQRAERLLMSALSPRQREQYELFNYFDVTGGASGRRFRVRRGSQMNVQELHDSARPVRLLCLVPVEALPVGDVMLAQKLALELFEPEALELAREAPMLLPTSTYEF